MSVVDPDVFFKRGYVVIPFTRRGALLRLQALVRSYFSGSQPSALKLAGLMQDEHTLLVKKINDKIMESRLVRDLIRENSGTFERFLGPAIDIQAAPHLRLSRPRLESDLVGWHRDSFYGNKPWEVNVWFPVFKLLPGAGLRILPGSQREPSRNVRDATDSDPFRAGVKKGSLAHQIGHVYSPKIDDTLAAMKIEDTDLIAPKVGQAIFFFGSCAHKAQNHSSGVRVSIDLRMKNAYAASGTRTGYYEPLCRGPVELCTESFHKS
ncbi:MAG: hypothetical protein A2901_08215 [Elusimicrobia bacterium RIFCSPLOWO2_01_FULL_54_10]|nr:MAG: hypothetical protein A2901_08215 [Elusimicrobia bacterium RIFCSPLOWO2_01_FULL_54_10]